MLAVEIGTYALSVALASILWRNPAVLALCYILISLFMLYRWHTKSDLIFYFAAFVLGPIGELVATHYGAWKYSKPAFLIPIWLPFLWGIALLFMKKLSETLINKEWDGSNRPGMKCCLTKQTRPICELVGLFATLTCLNPRIREMIYNSLLVFTVFHPKEMIRQWSGSSFYLVQFSPW